MVYKIWRPQMTQDFQSKIVTARSALADAKQLLQSEISAYPTPISGCDAQYNHLIGERTRVLDAIGLLDSNIFVATPRTPLPTSGVESR